MNNLAGVILCGGESRRMGRDKGLILQEGIPWVLHMAGKLAFFHLPVVFSVNVSQADDYAARFPDVRLIVDSDAVLAGGPLKGLLSVHAQFPDRDLLLLACDMVDMDHLTIRFLVEAYCAGGEYDYYAYGEGSFYQTFCAIYTAAGLEGDLRDLSLQGLLRRGRTKTLAIPDSRAFRNYNTL